MRTGRDLIVAPEDAVVEWDGNEGGPPRPADASERGGPTAERFHHPTWFTRDADDVDTTRGEWPR